MHCCYGTIANKMYSWNLSLNESEIDSNLRWQSFSFNLLDEIRLGIKVAELIKKIRNDQII